MTLPLIVAITGATGVIYGVELLRVLKQLGEPVHLILSEAAGLNLGIETEYTLDDVRALADVVYSNKDVGAAVASEKRSTPPIALPPYSRAAGPRPCYSRGWASAPSCTLWARSGCTIRAASFWLRSAPWA